jgi:hypothetical protein
MKYFFDTEFIEDGHTIDLISIGIVREDGLHLSLLSNEYNYYKADDWVKGNVILPIYKALSQSQQMETEISDFHRRYGSSNTTIRRKIEEFVAGDADPRFVAYYADYDWVVFCQLFGRMIDLPKNFPMWCIDLKQMMWEHNLNDEWKEKNVPKNLNEHDALSDAMWNMHLYRAIVKDMLMKNYPMKYFPEQKI